MFTDFLEWLGSKWGDQNEYLECDACSRRFEWEPDVACPCGGELYVHVPHGEILAIRWGVWKGDQSWIPQRFYVLPGNDQSNYSCWKWLAREWRVRPWAGLSGMEGT